jgi:hypothetical protein
MSEWFSVTHYNALVTLEAEYAAFNSRIAAKYSEALQATGKIQDTLSKAVQEHDRHSLSKKFPRVLPGLPRSMLEVTES